MYAYVDGVDEVRMSSLNWMVLSGSYSNMMRSSSIRSIGWSSYFCKISVSMMFSRRLIERVYVYQTSDVGSSQSMSRSVGLEG